MPRATSTRSKPVGEVIPKSPIPTTRTTCILPTPPTARRSPTRCTNPTPSIATSTRSTPSHEGVRHELPTPTTRSSADLPGESFGLEALPPTSGPLAQRSRRGPGVAAPVLLLALIHPSAGKRISANFADAKECVAGILTVPRVGGDTEPEEVGRCYSRTRTPSSTEPVGISAAPSPG